ncbi:FAD/NAD(P)-binding domain-containing protein [Penicillium angulare]|uniref:FAD/NAD(P)-binding domain-containing protein n=1 Tax=Penicillium angulare TaxID=116970 RepID=UPI00253F8807|nr:FAD/NAD(P)-binding domain-containing protein [Penicillium angulare]KAJ5279607.1 FAD/NAD(P)-binding domain-containing protein [Penicillium angulare]
MSVKIAIIGAGPAGCMLARLLLDKPNINITVFEGEPSINFRAQGGSLDLHERAGLAALKAANLYEEFLKHARFEGEALLVCDEKLKPYIKIPPQAENKSTGRPEIDRSALRKMLLESLPSGVVQWNRRLRRVGPGENQKQDLEFMDGKIEPGFDLVVGADGTWSKVRPALSDTQPEYAGIGGFSLGIPNAAQTAPECSVLLKGGSVFAYSTGCMLVGQQQGDGSIDVGVWRARPEGWEETVDYDLKDGAAVRQAQKQEFAVYAPELLELIEKAVDEPHMAARSYYSLPVGFHWDHKPGLTLIGDSAHVICPFTGEGVNQALTDSMLLSQAILKAKSAADLDRQIRVYERDLFSRAAVFQERAALVAKTMFFTEGSPASTIEIYTMQNLKNYLSPTGYFLLYPVLATAVYGFFFWQKRFRH